MIQVLFQSLQPIDNCSFTLSVGLVQTSTEVLLLLSLELPSMHKNWRGVRCSLIRQLVCESLLLLPWVRHFDVVLLYIVSCSSSGKQICSETTMEEGGHGPLWLTQLHRCLIAPVVDRLLNGFSFFHLKHFYCPQNNLYFYQNISSLVQIFLLEQFSLYIFPCFQNDLYFLPKHFFLRIFSFLGAIYISIEIVELAKKNAI